MVRQVIFPGVASSRTDNKQKKKKRKEKKRNTFCTMLWIDERHSDVQGHDCSSSRGHRRRCLLTNRRFFTERSYNAWKITSHERFNRSHGRRCQRTPVHRSRYHDPFQRNEESTCHSVEKLRGIEDGEAFVRKPARLARSAIDLKLRFVSRIPHLTTLRDAPTTTRCSLLRLPSGPYFQSARSPTNSSLNDTRRRV